MHPKARAFVENQSTATLVTSLRILAAKANLDEHERMARAWIIEGLEDRYPDASAAVEAAFDSAESRAMEAADAGQPVEEIDYVAVLLAHVPA